MSKSPRQKFNGQMAMALISARAREILELVQQMGAPHRPVRYALTPALTQTSEACFFNVHDLAVALDVSKKTVLNRAAAGHWPARKEANRILFAPPLEVLSAACLVAAPKPTPPPEKRVKFTDLPKGDARAKVLTREKAVRYYLDLYAQNSLVELALTQTKAHFAVVDYEFSTGSLRRWVSDFQRWGLDGLVEQKAGRCGRKPKIK